MYSIHRIILSHTLSPFLVQGLRPRPGPYHNASQSNQLFQCHETCYGKAPASGVVLALSLEVDIELFLEKDKLKPRYKFFKGLTRLLCHKVNRTLFMGSIKIVRKDKSFRHYRMICLGFSGPLPGCLSFSRLPPLALPGCLSLSRLPPSALSLAASVSLGFWFSASLSLPHSLVSVPILLKGTLMNRRLRLASYLTYFLDLNPETNEKVKSKYILLYLWLRKNNLLISYTLVKLHSSLHPSAGPYHDTCQYIHIFRILRTGYGKTRASGVDFT